MSKRNKINRCSVCKEPLRHIQNNQWMCQQSPSKCTISTKVVYISDKKEEEE